MLRKDKCAQHQVSDAEQMHMQVHTAHNWASVFRVVETRIAEEL